MSTTAEKCPTVYGELWLDIFESRWVRRMHKNTGWPQDGCGMRVGVYGQRLLRHVVDTVRLGDGDSVCFHGGLGGVGDAVGGRPNGHTCRELLLSGALYRFRSRGYTVAGLWSYDSNGETVTLVLNRALREIGWSLRRLFWRNMVPVLPAPPLVGDKGHEWPAQGRFQVLLVDLLARRKREMADYGGALVADGEFEAMAKRADAIKDWRRVVDQWVSGEGGEPGMLERDGRGRISISRHGRWAPARAFLMGKDSTSDR